MIKNCWYALLTSGEVKKGRITSVVRLGKRMVFFRTASGKVACLEDLCAHRGASLAQGSVCGENIRCPFHGIEYDPEGKCAFIPSEGRASETDFSRFHIKSYPVRETGDIIFVWYGDGKPDGEPQPFEVMNDKRYAYSHLNDTWNVHYSRVIENQLDVSHLAFVHKTTIGRGNKTLVNGPKVEWLDENTMRTSANNETDQGQIPKPAEECVIKDTNLTFRFPNLWLNHVSDKIMITAFFVPVDDEHSIIALRFYNRLTGIKPLNQLIAGLGSWANKIVERQDKRVVETQLPKRSQLRMQENLVSADYPIIAYRSRRDELISQGD